MNPQHHEGRRTARAQTLERLYYYSKTTVFTDAADCACANTKTPMFTTPTRLITSITFRQTTIFEMEEAALALAIVQTQAKDIITDS